jgi:hypothetical protein
VVSFTPRPIYPQGKSRWYPLDRRLGGPQSHSRCGGEEKNVTFQKAEGKLFSACEVDKLIFLTQPLGLVLMIMA